MEIYNQDLKEKFILDYTRSNKTAALCRMVFRKTSAFETEFGQDFCTFHKDRLLDALMEVCGNSESTRRTLLSIIRGYVKYCMDNGISNCNQSILKLTVDDIPHSKESVRITSVGGPEVLQDYLNKIFDTEDERTTDIIYRCFFWLAFMGVEESDSTTIRSDSIDLDKMKMTYRGMCLKVYSESVQAFRSAICDTSFRYKHPNYKIDTERDRVPGNILLRGFRGNQDDIRTFRATISRRVTSAFASGTVTSKLNYANIKRSGIFYRVYQKEIASSFVDLQEEIERQLVEESERDNLPMKQYPILSKRSHAAVKDYVRWKDAWSL